MGHKQNMDICFFSKMLTQSLQEHGRVLLFAYIENIMCPPVLVMKCYFNRSYRQKKKKKKKKNHVHVNTWLNGW